MCKSRLAINRGSVQEECAGGVCRRGSGFGYSNSRARGVGLEGEEGAEADWDRSYILMFSIWKEARFKRSRSRP
jgi:hypothetical protein